MAGGEGLFCGVNTGSAKTFGCRYLELGTELGAQGMDAVRGRDGFQLLLGGFSREKESQCSHY